MKLFRHNKSGDTYELVHDDVMNEADGRIMVVYRRHPNGKLFTRRRQEFFDFVELNGKRVRRFEEVKGGD